MRLYELYAIDGSTHFVIGMRRDYRNDIITFNNGMEFRQDNIIYVKRIAEDFASIEEGQKNIDRIRAESGLTKVFIHYPKDTPTGPNHPEDTEEGDMHASN
jgi:hypothetical protein